MLSKFLLPVFFTDVSFYQTSTTKLKMRSSKVSLHVVCLDFFSTLMIENNQLQIFMSY